MIFFRNGIEPVYFSPELFDDLLICCYKNNISDISFQTATEIFIEKNQLLKCITQRKLTAHEIELISTHIYGANAVSILASGKDIDISYSTFDREVNMKYRYRVNMVSCLVDSNQGIQITIRVIKSTPPSIYTLGLDKKLINALVNPNKLNIISGATGSGKSTLIASVIRYILESKDISIKVVTYESPIEYIYTNISANDSIISQTEIPHQLKSFSEGIRNAMRRKPGLIVVGESRDYETISATLSAALSGHPVYTTIHGEGIVDTIRRIVLMFPMMEREFRYYDLIQSLNLIVWQSLTPNGTGGLIVNQHYLIFNQDIRNELLATNVHDFHIVLLKILKIYGVILRADPQYNAEELKEEDRLVSLMGENYMDKYHINPTHSLEHNKKVYS